MILVTFSTTNPPFFNAPHWTGWVEAASADTATVSSATNLAISKASLVRHTGTASINSALLFEISLTHERIRNETGTLADYHR